MSSVKLRLDSLRSCGSSILSSFIFGLKIFVVEVSVHVVIIIHPGSNLVRILLVEMSGGWFSINENVLAVETHMISLKSIISPQYHFTPQV